jgi:multidrug efflux pump subunit AcrB
MRLITQVVDWFSKLTTPQQALVVAAIGVGLTALALLFNRLDKWRERRAAKKKAKEEARDKLEAKQAAAQQPPPIQQAPVIAQPESDWQLNHDDGMVYILSLRGADAYNVEIWSTPAEQVMEYGTGKDDRSTIEIDHYPIGRRMSLFIFEGGFGTPTTRVHISWQAGPQSLDRKQIDIY